MSSDADGAIHWHKALDPDDLPKGRVTQATCDGTTVAITHYECEYHAMANECPHQGGPLGEGSIEDGLLRCPWHGWDFYPDSGETPGAFDDCVETFQTEVRDDGIYVGFPAEEPRDRTVSDVITETLVNWGVRQVWGIVGHSNLGLAEALRTEAVFAIDDACLALGPRTILQDALLDRLVESLGVELQLIGERE